MDRSLSRECELTGREGEWLWRVTWHNGIAYGAAYDSKTPSNAPSGPEWLLALYQSTDGVAWELVKKMEVTGRPNETTLRFTPAAGYRACQRCKPDRAPPDLTQADVMQAACRALASEATGVTGGSA